VKTLLLVLALLGPLEPVVQMDFAVRDAVQSHRVHALDRVMQGATDVGKAETVLGLLLAIAVFDPEGVVVGRVALVSLAATNLIVEGVKVAVGRVRPDGSGKRSNASFPSSHAANAFALALILARRWRRAAIGCWAFAALVAISRVWLNRHFLSDITCGALIGVACSLGSARLFHWRTRAAGLAAARRGGPARARRTHRTHRKAT